MLTVINNFIFCSGGTEVSFQKLLSLYFLKLTYTLFKFTYFWRQDATKHPSLALNSLGMSPLVVDS